MGEMGSKRKKEGSGRGDGWSIIYLYNSCDVDGDDGLRGCRRGRSDSFRLSGNQD